MPRAGGSVGPHVDQYDVFLLQAWVHAAGSTTRSRSPDAPVIPGLELAILQDFTPDQEVVLNPGDILYLPPGLAHHGVALEPCMTYSIGFRAPTAAQALESFALECERAMISRSERYQDAELELDRHPAEITDTEIERFRAMATPCWTTPRTCGAMRSARCCPIAPSRHPMRPMNNRCVYPICKRRPGFGIPRRGSFTTGRPERIEVYYNACVHELPRHPELLEQLQKLCENREWSVELMRESIASSSRSRYCCSNSRRSMQYYRLTE